MNTYLIFSDSVPVALYRAETLDDALKPYPGGFTALDIELSDSLAVHLASVIKCPSCQSSDHAPKGLSSLNQLRFSCNRCGKSYQVTGLFRGNFPDGLNKHQRHYRRNKQKRNQAQKRKRQEKRETKHLF